MFQPGAGVSAVTLAVAKTRAADTVGGVVLDVSAYKGIGLLVLSGGTFTKDSIGPIACAVTIKTGDSAAGGDATDTVATFTARDSTNMTAIATKLLDLTSCKRYIKANFDLGAHTTGAPTAMVGIFNARGY